jgi:hypothetical protein
LDKSFVDHLERFYGEKYDLSSRGTDVLLPISTWREAAVNEFKATGLFQANLQVFREWGITASRIATINSKPD